jgi:hypothetical protein
MGKQLKSSGSQVMGAKKFLKLIESEPDSIRSVKFVLPKLGVDNHFGKFNVEREVTIIDLSNEWR